MKIDIKNKKEKIQLDVGDLIVVEDLEYNTIKYFLVCYSEKSQFSYFLLNVESSRLLSFFTDLYNIITDNDKICMYSHYKVLKVIKSDELKLSSME